MAIDPFDALIRRLASQATRRRSLGALGLLGLSGAALPGETEAKQKRKRKKKNKTKGQATTTPAPVTINPATTRTPGICGAAGTNCGTAQTACICAPSPEDLENVRCVAFMGPPLDTCLEDSDCTGRKVCILEPASQSSAFCLPLCGLKGTPARRRGSTARRLGW